VIGRVWRGWAKPELANAYEELLTKETLPALHRVAGYKGSYFIRCTLETGEIELWEAMDSIFAFAGEDSTRAVVPLDTQALLTRVDDRSVHYDATWCH
jgi:hypothetical protein